MARIDLTVEYKEKEIVKKAGARYDTGKKVWYIDDQNAKQMSNLEVFRPYILNVEWYIEKRLTQIDMASEEAKILLNWKTHLEDVKVRREKGEEVYADLSSWFGWRS